VGVDLEQELSPLGLRHRLPELIEVAQQRKGALSQGLA
jgi:hypothetical protein